MLAVREGRNTARKPRPLATAASMRGRRVTPGAAPGSTSKLSQRAPINDAGAGNKLHVIIARACSRVVIVCRRARPFTHT